MPDQVQVEPFPLGQKTSLTREDVVNYLVECKGEGHTVYQGGGENFFTLMVDDQRIYIMQQFPGEPWKVLYEKLGERTPAARAWTRTELERGVKQAAGLCNKDWPCRPTTGRLSAETPATNYRTIAQLVGSSQIEAVFDPYLDNRALATVIDILSFGSGRVANGVRLLGSTKMAGGAIPKLSKVGVHAWLKQQGITGEARMGPATEHRRFMLLGGGQSLIMGPSLNAIHKNEALHIEPDADDRAFFDEVWVSATTLT
jgi:hypothetical protein